MLFCMRGENRSTRRKTPRRRVENSAEKLDLHIAQNLDIARNPRHTSDIPVAQLVEYRAVTREAVSSTPAGPTLSVFK